MPRALLESGAMTSETHANEPHGEPAPEGVACDFCGQVVDSVRRVALDGDYERLRTRHQPLYSCQPCFEKKERERTASAG